MWLLRQDVAREMREWRAGLSLSAEQCTAFAAQNVTASAPRNLRIAGDTAEIAIDGVLTEKADIFAWLFGGGNTTYTDIRAALAMADADPSVKRIVLNVNSPGGQVAGLFETLAAIGATSKPITVRSSLAASAAYAIAAVAGKIEATNPAAEFGSVGVVATYFVDDELVDITSTEAPNKRPDPSTPEGQAVIREHLDAIHELFVEAIAGGRGVSVKDVNADFGRGSVLLAGEAKKRGMIDRVIKPTMKARVRAEEDAAEPVARVGDIVAVFIDPKQNASAASGGAPNPPKGIPKMTKEELKAQHPELYAAIHAQGVSDERDRVCAHLTLGDSSGDMKTAIEAVTNGVEMTQTLTAKYLSAGMRRNEQTARQTESDAAGAAVAGVAPAPAAEDFGDRVVASLKKMNGGV